MNDEYTGRELIDEEDCNHPSSRNYSGEYFHADLDENGDVLDFYPALWIGCLDCGEVLAEGLRLKKSKRVR